MNIHTMYVGDVRLYAEEGVFLSVLCVCVVFNTDQKKNCGSLNPIFYEDNA